MGTFCSCFKNNPHFEGSKIYIQKISQFSSNKITLKDFEKVKLLGQGAYGNVFLVKAVGVDNLYFAMKVVNKLRLKNQKQKNNVINERNIMTKINFPFLAVLRFALQDADNLYFFTDFAQGGELFFHMKKEGRFFEDKVKFYCAEIILSLEYLHSQKIIYRDLKPENVLIDDQGHIVLTDFGLSIMINDFNDRATTICGTKSYLAPEIVEGKGYNNSVDWWSLGCLAYEMLTGKQAYNVKAINKSVYNEKPPIFAYLSNDACNFVFSLLNQDPQIRTSKNPRDHRFFRGVNFDDIKYKRIPPPFVPEVDGPTDLRYFDKQFTSQDIDNVIYNNIFKLGHLDVSTNDKSIEEDLGDEAFLNFSFTNTNINGNTVQDIK